MQDALDIHKEGGKYVGILARRGGPFLILDLERFSLMPIAALRILLQWELMAGIGKFSTMSSAELWKLLERMGNWDAKHSSESLRIR
mmetsp:Transcript_25373/g.47996  ORF Transcript_25373/g.47996 Transcript_25373/m.47996 type:complete len:87 (-) Transcript_25373:239-499(-)